MKPGALYAGIETGGTAIRICVEDETGTPHVVTRFATSTPDETVRNILFHLGHPMVSGRLAGIGIASFGPIRLDPSAPDHGALLSTTKPGWTGFNLPAAIARETAAPVTFDTDVNCAAIAEQGQGAGKGLASLAYVTVGTGIGAGLALADGTLKGALHPEAGHLRIGRAPGDAAPSLCSFHDDCAEGLAAGPAIRARLGGGRLEDAPETFDLIARYLGRLCASLLLAWAPHRIVIGGEVLAVPGLRNAIAPEILASLNGYGPVDLALRPDFLAAPTIADAGLAGALRLARAIAHRPANGTAWSRASHGLPCIHGA